MDYMTWEDFVIMMMFLLAVARFILELFKNNNKKDNRPTSNCTVIF